MNLRTNYKINKTWRIYAKNQGRLRSGSAPFAGARNVKRFEILKKAKRTAVSSTCLSRDFQAEDGFSMW